MRIQNPESRIQNGGSASARPAAKSFEDLIVWQKAHQFVLSVYRFTESFPNKELYGLTSQLRRAAVSIPANIAEGFKKRDKADKARFLNIAQSSLEECRYHLILASDLNYGDASPLKLQLSEVSKLLEAYARAILDSGF
ncbi:MAG: four helix bundle protein [Verrucomicrobia bacterium]|nr:four helix bundle protein [Verrucomicrobiota bacterium]